MTTSTQTPVSLMGSPSETLFDKEKFMQDQIRKKFIESLRNFGFSEEESEKISTCYEDDMARTAYEEVTAQLWFSRWHEGKRLLVWESQAPGPDYFVLSVNIKDALNEHLNPVLQVDFRDAPQHLHDLYAQPHSAKYIVYDNGSDYKLVAYEYI